MGVRSLKNSIWLSLAVHTIFFLVCACLFWEQATLPPSFHLTWVDVAAPPKAKKRRQVETPPSNKQIVVTEKGMKVDQPRPDAFLGERNQIVTEETVGKTQILGATEKSQAKHSAEKKAQSQARSQAQDTQNENAVRQPQVLGALGVPIISHLKELGEADAQLDRPWANDGQRVQDYVKGLKESNQTALNTREFVFFGYFQRIRERLDRAWVPILREKLTKFYYSGRKLASDMDHSTRILVVLNHKGEITRVQVVSESGTHDLDDAAVRAFNQAGPFPNPPRGIVDKNGEIQIPWEFILRT